MKTIKKLLFSILVIGFAGNVYAGSASTKLSALAESLIKGYTAKTGVSKTALAVFPLNCEEKLEKQRVGFAASEVMSHRFVADGAFTVVERGELGKLLSEQKLQASGIVDNETAVKLGKILGAVVILVGNIQKLGGKYQVNTRLVDAETSQVLVSGYAELDTAAFEDDARVYLNLVPEKQTLGIYGVYSYRGKTHGEAAFVETEPLGGTNTVWPKSFSSSLAGGGLLYRPGRYLQINAECAASLAVPQYSTIVTSWYVMQSRVKIITVSLMLSYVARFSEKWGYWAGLGVQRISLNPNVYASMQTTQGLLIKSGIEYKPQSRMGIGLNLKYELSRPALHTDQGTKFFELNPLSFESTLTFYF